MTIEPMRAAAAEEAEEHMVFARPTPGTYNDYFAKYINLVPDGDLRRLLPVIFDANYRLLKTIPADKETYRYASGKWTVRNAVGHVADTERVFSYRALCFARGDTTPLPSFDENGYALHAPYDAIPLDQVLGELMAVHASTILLFENLADDAWDRIGVSSTGPLSVRAAAYIIAGHEMHHMNVLRDKYQVIDF
jgi:hypothetical protein